MSLDEVVRELKQWLDAEVKRYEEIAKQTSPIETVAPEVAELERCNAERRAAIVRRLLDPRDVEAARALRQIAAAIDPQFARLLVGEIVEVAARYHEARLRERSGELSGVRDRIRRIAGTAGVLAAELRALLADPALPHIKPLWGQHASDHAWLDQVSSDLAILASEPPVNLSDETVTEILQSRQRSPRDAMRAFLLGLKRLQEAGFMPPDRPSAAALASLLTAALGLPEPLGEDNVRNVLRECWPD